jgi:hypothetical protein
MIYWIADFLTFNWQNLKKAELLAWKEKNHYPVNQGVWT